MNFRFTLKLAPSPSALETLAVGIFVYPYPVSKTVKLTICPRLLTPIWNDPPSPSSKVTVSPSVYPIPVSIMSTLSIVATASLFPVPLVPPVPSPSPPDVVVVSLPVVVPPSSKTFPPPELVPPPPVVSSAVFPPSPSPPVPSPPVPSSSSSSGGFTPGIESGGVPWVAIKVIDCVVVWIIEPLFCDAIPLSFSAVRVYVRETPDPSDGKFRLFGITVVIAPLSGKESFVSAPDSETVSAFCVSQLSKTSSPVTTFVFDAVKELITGASVFTFSEDSPSWLTVRMKVCSTTWGEEPWFILVAFNVNVFVVWVSFGAKVTSSSITGRVALPTKGKAVYPSICNETSSALTTFQFKVTELLTVNGLGAP